MREAPWSSLTVAAYAPHFPIDVKALDFNFYVFSLYKVCGPHQSVLYGKRASLFQNLLAR